MPKFLDTGLPLPLWTLDFLDTGHRPRSAPLACAQPPACLHRHARCPWPTLTSCLPNTCNTRLTTQYLSYFIAGFRTSRRPVGLCACHTHYGSAGFRTSRRPVGLRTCHTHYGSAGFRTSRRPVGPRTCHTHYGSAGFRTSQRLLPLLPLLPLHTHAMFIVPHLLVSLIKLVSCCWGLRFFDNV